MPYTEHIRAAIVHRCISNGSVSTMSATAIFQINTEIILFLFFAFWLVCCCRFFSFFFSFRLLLSCNINFEWGLRVCHFHIEFHLCVCVCVLLLLPLLMLYSIWVQIAYITIYRGKKNVLALEHSAVMQIFAFTTVAYSGSNSNQIQIYRRTMTESIGEVMASKQNRQQTRICGILSKQQQNPNRKKAREKKSKTNLLQNQMISC